jgi:hypothetical protein
VQLEQLGVNGTNAPYHTGGYHLGPPTARSRC